MKLLRHPEKVGKAKRIAHRSLAHQQPSLPLFLHHALDLTQFCSFCSFYVLETGRDPEKVGKAVRIAH